MRIAWIALCGLLLLALEWRCQRDNLLRAQGLQVSRAWLCCFRRASLLGLPLGVVAVFAVLPVGGQNVATVIGCPFPAIFLDARGRDFVGITTPIAAIANFYIGLRAPTLLLWFWGRRSLPADPATVLDNEPEMNA